MTTRRPAPDEYAPFYEGYVARVPEDDVIAVLVAQRDVLAGVAAAVSPEREGHRYAPGKWSVRQVFGHLADAERLFGYRALCIGRGDPTPLPGFDENSYVDGGGFEHRPLAELTAELVAVRDANLPLLRSFGEADWRRRGTANGVAVSTRAIAWILAGHVRHHLAVLSERYGVGAPA
jgi:hypothetical protein